MAIFFNEKHSVKASFAGFIYDLQFSVLGPVSRENPAWNVVQ